MRYILKTTFSIICLLFTSNLFAQSQEEVEQYIEKYKRLAIEEQIRSGVPAAITLAQGIHEATAGTSELATQANNHFGIKCKSTWTGMTYLHDDDAKQECFRKYSSVEQSYIDHSDFLKNNNRYRALFDLEVTDYKGWASELKRAGYATNPTYVKRLTDAVEKYNLQVFTTEAINKKNVISGEIVPEKDKEPNKETVITINKEEPKKEVTNPLTETIYYKGLKGFYGKKGDMLLEKAMEYNIRYARLLQINELEDAPLPFDMFVFTEKKRKVGTVEFHQVQNGESMLLIAQKEAMALDNLFAFNNILEGQEPEIGEQLHLQYKMVGTPKLKTKFLEPLVAKEEMKISTPEKAEAVVKEELEKTIPLEKEIKKEVIEEVKKEEIAKDIPVVEEVKPEIAKEEDVPVLSNEELQKMETLKNELQKQEEKKEEVVVNETPKEEVKKIIVIDENSPIKDIEKAKRIEALLSKEKKVDTDVLVKEVVVKEEPKAEKVKEIDKNEDVKTIPLAIKKEVRVAPKRTYTEKNVDADTKSLKEKFDAAVYKPLPERKIVKETSTGIIRDTVKRVLVKKETLNPKAGASKTEVNKNVKKTTTGIAKGLKKEDSKKEVLSAKDKNAKKDIPKSKGQKTENAKDKKTEKKEKTDSKTDKKKVEDKKKTDKEETTKTSKKK
jgi:hypothetical protein